MGNLTDMTYLHPAAPGNGLQRLLIPIDASTESRWGLRHAVQLAAAVDPSTPYRCMGGFIRHMPHISPDL